MSGDLQGRAESHLGAVLGLAGFRIENFEIISGNGLSRTVIKILATASGAPDLRYVMLLGKASSPVAPNHAAEFTILRALADVPGMIVPAAHWLQSDAEPLGAPFVLTGLLPGTTNPRKLLEPHYAPHARRLIEQSFEMLGVLAAVPVGSLALGAEFAIPDPAHAAHTELARCEQVLRDCDCGSDVIAQAAIRFLHRHPPPRPAGISVVHGDYRLGNYLFEPTGLTGIIDWEMVHIGDAIEDLAWALLPLWEYGARPGLAGGVLTRGEAIAAWQRGSGLPVDPAALHWWTVLCNLKAFGIWDTARTQFATSPQSGFMPGLVGYAMPQKQAATLAGLLHPAAA